METPSTPVEHPTGSRKQAETRSCSRTRSGDISNHERTVEKDGRARFRIFLQTFQPFFQPVGKKNSPVVPQKIQRQGLVIHQNAPATFKDLLEFRLPNLFFFRIPSVISTFTDRVHHRQHLDNNNSDSKNKDRNETATKTKTTRRDATFITSALLNYFPKTRLNGSKSVNTTLFLPVVIVVVVSTFLPAPSKQLLPLLLVERMSDRVPDTKSEVQVGAIARSFVRPPARARTRGRASIRVMFGFRSVIVSFLFSIFFFH